MANIAIKGIRLFPKKETQPDFVIASGVITPDDLNAFLIDNKEHQSEYNGAKQFRIQILKGKDGNGPYMVLDTYKGATDGPVEPLKGPVTELPETTIDLPF
jgi:hypothetical protein